MARRRDTLRNAWIGLIAILLSAIPPVGAHGHAARAGFGGHADFCSTAAGAPPIPMSPMPAHDHSKACTHCDGCTGSFGGSWAPPLATAPAMSVSSPRTAIVTVAPPRATPVDLIAAPPRGPPQPA